MVSPLESKTISCCRPWYGPLRATAAFTGSPVFGFQGCEYDGGGIVGRNGAVSWVALEPFEVSVAEFFESR